MAFWRAGHSLQAQCGTSSKKPREVRIPTDFLSRNADQCCEVIAMDTATKNQISILSFVIGLILLFVPYLKNFDAVIPGISPYFSLMFYLGLVLIMVGYYLK